MNVSNFTLALTTLSCVVSLFTEAFKTFLDSMGVKYASNVLVGVISLVCGIAYCVAYPCFFEVEMNAQYIICCVMLVIMSFCSSMVGYDKIKQTLKQIGAE